MDFMDSSGIFRLSGHGRMPEIQDRFSPSIFSSCVELLGHAFALCGHAWM